MRAHKLRGSLVVGTSLLLLSGAALAQQQQPPEATQALPPAEAVSEGAPVHVSPTSIAEIQRMLNEAGYAAGPVDGIWGPEVSTAVATFQRDQGLDPTGTVTFETLHALDLGGVLTGEGVPERPEAEQPPQPEADQPPEPEQPAQQ